MTTSPASHGPATRRRSKLLPVDAVITGTQELRSRRGRTLLTAIGIASMVTVLGISSSSKADLLAEIDKLGNNLLQIQPGNDLFGERSKLQKQAPAMVRRIGAVQQASSVSKLNAGVQRNQYTDDTNGLDVLATEPPTPRHPRRNYRPRPLPRQPDRHAANRCARFRGRRTARYRRARRWASRADRWP